MSEHTPTPWEVDADFDYELCFTEAGDTMSGWQIYGPKSWPVAAAWVVGIVDRSTGRANAELIIRAVNAHDRLVAALEDLEFSGENDRGTPGWCPVCRAYRKHIKGCRIDAALALARGEVEA